VFPKSIPHSHLYQKHMGKPEVIFCCILRIERKFMKIERKLRIKIWNDQQMKYLEFFVWRTIVSDVLNNSKLYWLKIPILITKIVKFSSDHLWLHVWVWGQNFVSLHFSISSFLMKFFTERAGGVKGGHFWG